MRTLELKNFSLLSLSLYFPFTSITMLDVEESKRGRVEKAGLWGDWSGKTWDGVEAEGLGRRGLC